jgi:Tfp pilus assembly protein PilV
MKRFRRIQAGLSMMEVMVTLLLVTLGMLVVMSSFIAISKAQHYGERMETATTLMRMEMERIRNMPYANVRAETGAYREYTDYPEYRHEVAVTDLGSTKQITLRIYFEHDRRRVEGTTFVANL